ncbi:MAG: carboxypeptidase regulatory-like domain-containing protein [Acidimicrobiales bacterium]|nr:carboxypeptidase regulatory-like domain-containing protein [Acidimicrobiales bacterium]
MLGVVALVVAALLAPSGARAAETPTGTVHGIVRDAADDAPVAGAWIVLMRAYDQAPVAQAVASASGEFESDVPAGTYLVYVIDPSGRHHAGFAGAPDLVRVDPGARTEVLASAPPATGTVRGVVSDATTRSGVSGAWVLVLGPSGEAERAVRTGSDGAYVVEDLPAGPRRLAFFDPTAAHATAYYDDAPNALAADTVDVVGGGTAVADAALARQLTSPAFTSVRGTVTDAVSGAPVDGALVLALRTSDLRLAGAAQATSSGRYRVNVPLGSYKLAFVAPDGDHAMEWHADQPFHAVDAAATVVAPAIANAALDPTTGRLEGAVREEGTDEPVADAWVLSIDASGRLRGAVTDESGELSISGLPLGTYRAAVMDTTGGRALQYWDGHPDFAAADTFTVEPGEPTAIVSTLGAGGSATFLDEAVGWWEASTGLLPDGSLPDLSGFGHDLELREGPEPSYPPALVAPDPARGRHLFSPGWDDMYLDTPDPTAPITGIDVAWDGDLHRVLDVAAWKDVNWLVHQGSSDGGTFSWAVGVVAATGQVEVRWSEDGSTVSSLRTTAAFPSGAQRGAVTLDPVTGDLVVYRQGPDAAPASFDLAYDGPEWVEVERVAGTGPVVLHDSTDPVRHSSAVPRDRIGDSTGEGWFEALYALRVRTAPGGPTAAAFDVGLVPDEPEWELETGLPPLFPGNEDGEASSTRFPGGAGETWTIHNYTTSSYPILLVDRPSVLFGNRSYASAGIDDDVFGIEPGEDLSVWIAYSYPRVGTGGGPYVAVKDWSPDATAPGWALLSSPFFAGPSAVVSDGTAVVHDPAPAVTDSRLNLSGFQIDGTAGTVQSFSNGVATEAPVSIAGLGPLAAPGTPLTVAGYGDTGTQGPSFAFAALVVFDRTLTPEEIERLPAELGLVPE